LLCYVILFWGKTSDTALVKFIGANTWQIRQLVQQMHVHDKMNIEASHQYLVAAYKE
jgi:hypothetical protein